MRADRRHAVAVLAALSVLGGCAHERVVWPPTQEKVAEISYAAYDDLYVRVEWVDPIAAKRELGDELHTQRIVWFDNEQIIFRTREGALLPVPAEKVQGLTVKHRGRGALIGALVGAGSGAAMMLGSWYLFDAMGDNDYFVNSACPGACTAKLIASWVAGTTLIGMAVGFMISGKHTYDFVPAR
jgi:hypothetical protein